MLKFLILFSSLVVLSACSKDEDLSETNSSTSINSTTSETTSSFTLESGSEQATTNNSKEKKQNFPYAVDMNDFVKKVTVNNKSKQTTYDLTFITEQKGLPQSITVNTKDLNDFGNAIYISSKGKEVSYPASISAVPTKTINIVGNNEKMRKVKVNTQVKIETYEKDKEDPLHIVGDTYFLFYNRQKTISLATRNFDKNSGPEDLNTTDMVEYIQEIYEDTNTSKTNEEDTRADKYYDLIKKAWKKQKDYIASIDDPKEKQSVQTTQSAAIMEATRLENENPDDTDIIKESLKRVLDGK